MKNKILVIDDEFLIRYTLAEGLKDRGYETESAGSVEEGLEKMKTFGPEVILLDNLLENSRGMDEIPAFRKLDENVQVIMMTAYGSVSQAVEAIKQGGLRLRVKALRHRRDRDHHKPQPGKREKPGIPGVFKGTDEGISGQQRERQTDPVGHRASGGKFLGQRDDPR